MTEVRTEAIAYRVTCLPPDAGIEDLIRYSATVWCRGQLADLPDGRCWSVERYDTAQLGRDGQWAYRPPEWDLEWIEQHRFDRSTAFDRAADCARNLAQIWKKA